MTWCVLGAVGCREPVTPEDKVSVEQAVVTERVREEPARQALPASAPVLARSMPEQTQPVIPVRQEPAEVPLMEEERQTSPAPEAPRDQASLLEEDDRIWLSETAESARAGNANIPPNMPTEKITIASGMVDGRVKRVRARTIEVADPEGNVYELRIDQHSRGVRQGRNIPLRSISAGTPVRASFDLVGNGASLARDIVLRR